MDHMMCSISKIIGDTYIVPPIPTLTNLTSKQGGYLPIKLQKSWKRELSIYHIIRKAIKITTQDTNWRFHPIITNLQNHTHTIIPNPPNNPTLIYEWIRTLGTIGKKAKKEAQDIIAKQTTINCKKTISKYRNTLNLQPKRTHKVIFKNIENTILDSIKVREGNILTKLLERHSRRSLYPTIHIQPACHTNLSSSTKPWSKVCMWNQTISMAWPKWICIRKMWRNKCFCSQHIW